MGITDAEKGSDSGSTVDRFKTNRAWVYRRKAPVFTSACVSLPPKTSAQA